MIDYEDLHWWSDWNGYEVGYDHVSVVGLYALKINPSIHFYIDTENGIILEAWSDSDYEE